MLKGGLALTLALLLTACAGSATAPDSGLPHPEADPSAPGMIPAECESLLQKAQDWGYQPTGKWKPASRDQALAALRFFEAFHLVPAVSSDFFRAFAEATIPEDEAAQKVMFDQTGKAQVCDFSLASQFMTELTKYPWPKADRPEVAKIFHRFALNQQAKAMPLLPRMAAIQIFSSAIKAGLVSGSYQAFVSLGREGENAVSRGKTIDEGATYKEWLTSFQREVQASEKLREKMARLMPLP
jgi:hypothetical protein